MLDCSLMILIKEDNFYLSNKYAKTLYPFILGILFVIFSLPPLSPYTPHDDGSMAAPPYHHTHYLAA